MFGEILDLASSVSKFKIGKIDITITNPNGKNPSTSNDNENTPKWYYMM